MASCRSMINDKTPGIRWKGRMEQKDVVRTVEHITSTGNDQLDPEQMKYVKRGEKRDLCQFFIEN